MVSNHNDSGLKCCYNGSNISNWHQAPTCFANDSQQLQKNVQLLEIQTLRNMHFVAGGTFREGGREKVCVCVCVYALLCVCVCACMHEFRLLIFSVYNKRHFLGFFFFHYAFHYAFHFV